MLEKRDMSLIRYSETAQCELLYANINLQEINFQKSSSEAQCYIVFFMAWRQKAFLISGDCRVCIHDNEAWTPNSYFTIWVKGLHTKLTRLSRKETFLTSERPVCPQVYAQFIRKTQTACTLIVSSGCPAKTRQTPPKPPAKKFFRGLIGFCCCFDILIPSWWRTKKRRLN